MSNPSVKLFTEIGVSISVVTYDCYRQFKDHVERLNWKVISHSMSITPLDTKQFYCAISVVYEE